MADREVTKEFAEWFWQKQGTTIGGESYLRKLNDLAPGTQKLRYEVQGPYIYAVKLKKPKIATETNDGTKDMTLVKVGLTQVDTSQDRVHSRINTLRQEITTHVQNTIIRIRKETEKELKVKISTLEKEREKKMELTKEIEEMKGKLDKLEKKTEEMVKEKKDWTPETEKKMEDEIKQQKAVIDKLIKDMNKSKNRPAIQKEINNKQRRLCELTEEFDKHQFCSVLFVLSIDALDTRRFADVEAEIRRKVGLEVPKNICKALDLPVPTEWVITTETFITLIRNHIKLMSEDGTSIRDELESGKIDTKVVFDENGLKFDMNVAKVSGVSDSFDVIKKYKHHEVQVEHEVKNDKRSKKAYKYDEVPFTTEVTTEKHLFQLAKSKKEQSRLSE